MRYLKSALLFLFLGIAIGGSYLLFCYDSIYFSHQALNAYQKGNLEQAHLFLNKVRSPKLQAETALFQFYIAQKQDNSVEAKKYLEQAITSISSEASMKTQEEIYLNAAVKAFYNGRLDTLEKYTKQLYLIGASTGSIEFTEGLVAYLEKKYAQAKHHWQKPLQVESFSPWMKTGFEITPSKLNLFIAFCDIQLNEIAYARARLQKVALDSSDPLILIEKNGMISLSYLEEGLTKNKNLSSKNEYLEALSYCHFSELSKIQTPLLRSAWEEKIALAAQKALQQELFEDFICLVNALQKMEQNSVLDSLSFQLSELIHKNIQKNHRSAITDFSKKITQNVEKGIFQSYLNAHLQQTLFQWIKEKKLEPISEYWDVVQFIVLDPAIVKKKLSEQLQDTLIECIKENPYAHQQTPLLLKTWTHIQNDPLKKFELVASSIQALIEAQYAPQWNQKLPAIISELEGLIEKPYFAKFKELLSRGLQIAYERAQNQDNVVSLNTIFDLAQTYELDNVATFDNHLIANRIADAEFQKKMERFDLVLASAEWILRADPYHQKAHELAAIALFAKDQFSDAAEHVEKIVYPTAELREIKGLSYFYIGQNDKGYEILQSLGQEQKLQSKSYHQLVYYSLEKQAWKEAEKWLSYLDKQEPLVCLLHLISHWQQGNIKMSLKEVQNLPYPFNALKSIHLIHAQILARLGKLIESESLFLTSFDLNNKIDIPLDLNFLRIKEKYLDTLDCYAETAIFYQDCLQDHRTAIRYFASVEHPSSVIVYRHAKAHLEEQNYLLAQRLLDIFLHIPQDDPWQEPGCRLLLGILESENKWDEALEVIHLQLDTKDSSLHNYWSLAQGRVLGKMGRWDLAQKIYEKHQDQLDTAQDWIWLVSTYQNTLQSQKIPFKVYEQLHADNQTLIEKLELALLLAQENKAAVHQFYKTIATEPLSSLATSYLARLALILGYPEQTEKILQEKQQENITELDRYTLAELALIYEDSKKALAWIDPMQKQTKHRPTDYWSILSQIKYDKKLALGKIEPLEKELKSLSSFADIKECMRHLIYYSKNAYPLIDSTHIETLYQTWLAIGGESYPDPFSYLIQAELAFLLNQYSESMTAALHALEYYPAFSEAHHLLSKIYTKQGLHEQAIYHLQIALSFDPFNISKRLDLSELYCKVNQLSTAEEILKPLLLLSPHHLQINLQYAHIHLLHGNAQKAHELLTYLQKTHPDSSSALAISQCLNHPHWNDFETHKEELAQLIVHLFD